jgi:hypothetical protein
VIVYGLPWCLHKHHDETWEVTRHMDPGPVYLTPCGGIITEPAPECS